MKKSSTVFIMLVMTVIFLAFASYNATGARASSNYQIESVNHDVQVLYNGYVVINDTITMSGQPNSFIMGFPHVFGSDVINAFAYGTSDMSTKLPVTLNVPMQDDTGAYRAGYYGARVDFTDGAPQVFSVVFVLSNNLLKQDSNNASLYTLSFPAFPSFTETAPFVNCSIAVPGALYLNGTVSGFIYNATNLAAFTYDVSQVDAYVPSNNIQIFEIQQLTRQVEIDAFGQITVSDSYHLTNNSTQGLGSVDVDVPLNASNISAYDALGALSQQIVSEETGLNRSRIGFSLSAAPTAVEAFTVTYHLPDNVYVSRQGNVFVINMMFFQEEKVYIDQVSVGFVLPEGARLSSFSTTAPGNSYGVKRDVFQESLTVDQQQVISADSFAVSLSYSYDALWLALVPTMWMWALSIVGSVVVLAWKIPKAPSEVVGPPTGARLRPEDVRSFVDSYDEKMKIESEIDLLEDRVQKGRIPRRRYKAQKRTFEIRLNTIDKALGEIGGRMHSAGGHYSDLMKQLEIAETEIDEVEANMKSIEARHGRAEISLETYRKLLADYERRKDRAKATINGILLRLREEMQ